MGRIKVEKELTFCRKCNNVVGYDCECNLDVEKAVKEIKFTKPDKDRDETVSSLKSKLQ